MNNAHNLNFDNGRFELRVDRTCEHYRLVVPTLAADWEIVSAASRSSPHPYEYLPDASLGGRMTIGGGERTN